MLSISHMGVGGSDVSQVPYKEGAGFLAFAQASVPSPCPSPSPSPSLQEAGSYRSPWCVRRMPGGTHARPPTRWARTGCTMS